MARVLLANLNFVCGICSLAMMIVPAVASAQNWPNKPIRFIVSQPTGTGPDILARLYAEKLGPIWNQPVIIENRPGGASIIGIQAAARSPADGYNYLFTTGGILLNVYNFKTLPYDVERDFVAVAFLGRAPLLLVANNDLPVKTAADLVALVKANPGKYSFASDGPRGLSGLMGEVFNALAGSKSVHVPYNGSTPGLQDTMVGRTHYSFQSAAPTIPWIRGGKLKGLAISMGKTMAGLETVPPMKDTLPEFEFMGWYMLYAPTGVPADVVRRVNRDIDTIFKDKPFTEKLVTMGPIVEEAGSPEFLREFHRAEHQRWRRMVQLTGLQPE
ncbi:MAG: Bug family tripartite tricarboxylate transporter substrate binding protein [Burkholderiales bacterium]